MPLGPPHSFASRPTLRHGGHVGVLNNSEKSLLGIFGSIIMQNKSDILLWL